MQIIKSISSLKEMISHLKSLGNSISFVSTMGALHDGHTSLVSHAKTISNVVIAGIFLNPTHFAQNEDYSSYPRTLDEDCKKLEAVNCDLVFIPEIKDIYPLGVENSIEIHFPSLGSLYCGKSRPHFFGAVCTVVTKLLNIVTPDIALFGEKDYQQLIICKRLVEELFLPIKVVGVPTVREANGLAMSSRNLYLNEKEKEHASLLYKCLQESKQLFLDGENDFKKLEQLAIKKLTNAKFKVDYYSFVHSQTLAPAESKDLPIVILAAVYLNNVRLIDNIIVSLKELKHE